MPITTPAPVFVMSNDGIKLATYQYGDSNDPTVVAVHGFASSAVGNWQLTGWIRDLTRAGFHVVAIDQRGHGASDKPHDPTAYSMQLLVDDLTTVLDTYLIDDALFVGYSLGARVGWHAAIELPHLIRKAVLGGIPDGDPLTRFNVQSARAFVETGAHVDDPLTKAYLTMASGIEGNDLEALVCLVEGMRGGLQPDPANPPLLPVLFATGSEDSILARSRSLAEATPRASFFEIPERNHFNAPTSGRFRAAALEFLVNP